MQVEIRQSDAFVLHNFLLPIPVVRCSDLGQGGKKKFLEVQVGPVGKNMFSLSIALSIYGNLPKLYLPARCLFPAFSEETWHPTSKQRKNCQKKVPRTPQRNARGRCATTQWSPAELPE